MLRPLLAFGALAMLAFLMAPTVMSVHQGVEALGVVRKTPWDVWKWGTPKDPIVPPPGCGPQHFDTESEITEWPVRMQKSEPFRLGGLVTVPAEGDRGVGGVKVDIFLNETKEEPGVLLGSTHTNDGGTFTLEGTLPFDLQATKYHLVAHAHRHQIGCEFYREHWSDPEMEVLSETKLSLILPERVVLGHDATISGRLVDAVGAPVLDEEIDLIIDGETVKVRTDGSGLFRHVLPTPRLGNVSVEADFDATDYYGGSHAKGHFLVVAEDVQLDDLVGGQLRLMRGEETTVAGDVVLPKGKEHAPLTIDFDGVKVAPCAACPLSSKITVQPDASGRFAVTVFAAADQDLGPFKVTMRDGGLEQSVDYDGVLLGRVVVTLEADGAGLFAKQYEATARAVDDRGAPAAGVIAVLGPGGWTSGAADANGTFSYAASAPCGRYDLRAVHNGSDTLAPGAAERTVSVCGFLAFLPPFIVDFPWWGWLLILIAAYVAYRTARWVQAKYAAVIMRGPPLILVFTQPNDAAAGIVSVGEAATLSALLEEPLPAGHRLRLGTLSRMDEAEIIDGRATFTFVPDEPGEIPIRADVVNAKGRVVSRRTAKLRVVRYAQEIERRHLEMRHRALGAAAEPVTPREFEAWLLERSPGLDPEVAQRLVSIFEEADYGPRDVARRELVAYMEAEVSVPEVAPHVA